MVRFWMCFGGFVRSYIGSELERRVMDGSKVGLSNEKDGVAILGM